MYTLIKSAKFITPVVVSLGLLTSTGQAAVFTGGTMTFDNGANKSVSVKGVKKTPGPMAASVFPGFGQSYVENGIEFSAIGFGAKGNGTKPGNSIGNPFSLGSHVHGEVQSASNPNRVVALFSDSAGGMFQLEDHSAFGVGGVDVADLNLNMLKNSKPNGQTTMTIRGYTSSDFSTFFDVKLAGGADGMTPTITQGPCATTACTAKGNATNGFLGTHLFLDNFKELQDVYLVEYWYDSLGRGKDGSLNPDFGNLKIRLDNLQLTAPQAVPLPAAAWLFGTGLLGLFGLGRNRQNVSVREGVQS